MKSTLTVTKSGGSLKCDWTVDELGTAKINHTFVQVALKPKGNKEPAWGYWSRAIEQKKWHPNYITCWMIEGLPAGSYLVRVYHDTTAVDAASNTVPVTI